MLLEVLLSKNGNKWNNDRFNKLFFSIVFWIVFGLFFLWMSFVRVNITHKKKKIAFLTLTFNLKRNYKQRTTKNQTNWTTTFKYLSDHESSKIFIIFWRPKNKQRNWVIVINYDLFIFATKCCRNFRLWILLDMRI